MAACIAKSYQHYLYTQWGGVGVQNAAAYVLLIALHILRSKRGQVCPYLEEQWEGFPGIYPGNVVYTLATILSPHCLLSGFVQTKQTFVFTS